MGPKQLKIVKRSQNHSEPGCKFPMVGTRQVLTRYYQENSTELNRDEVEALDHRASRAPAMASGHCQKKKKKKMEFSLTYTQRQILKSGKYSPYITGQVIDSKCISAWDEKPNKC